MQLEFERLPEDIRQIIELENKFGHNGFLFEMESVEEISEKYTYVVEMINRIEESHNPEETDMILGMVSTGILSPEAIAYILSHECSNCRVVLEVIETYFEHKSVTDWLLFSGVFYRFRSQQLKRVALSKIRENGFWNFATRQYELRYGNCQYDQKWFKGKGAVYTIITGGYDQLQEPETINPEWDYFLFTDSPEKYSSDVWKIIVLDNSENLNPILLQRKVKCLPYLFLKDYDYTIYVDGKVHIVGDLSEYINIYAKECSMLCIPHPERQKIEDEAQAIIDLNKADPQKTLEQVKHYKSLGYKDERILPDTCILVRSNRDEKLNEVMNDWWKEIQKWTYRDQLSIGYCFWKNEYDYDISSFSLYGSKYVTVDAH